MKRCALRLIACGSCRHPEFMTIQGGSLCAVDFPALVGLIEHPDEGLILFDTGYDAAFLTATRPFPERLYRWTTPVKLDPADSAAAWLTRLGRRPEDVRAIVLSHFHGDHVAGLRAFPQARIFCAEEGLRQFGRLSRFGRVRRGLLDGLLPEDIAARAQYFEAVRRRPLPAGFAPFTDGADILGDGSLLAVPLPGHCPGHWGLALHLDDDRQAFLIGDAAWSGAAVERDVPPPGLTTALLGDTAGYRRTLTQLSAVRRNNGTLLILPSHCAASLRASGLAGGDDA